MWEKLCTYTLDVSKYILTGVVIASMFKEFADKVMMYVIGLFAAIVLLIAGLLLANESNRKKEDKNDKKGRR